MSEQSLSKKENGNFNLEKILIGDIAGLTASQKAHYIKSVSESVGVNHLLGAFQIIKFQGREILYATKACTDQLRKIHNISIEIVDEKVINGAYVVIAKATMPNGRVDMSKGVVSIEGLSGDALANALMKAETKAKRRVTLSICGLGILDESELDTMQGAVHVDVAVDDSVDEIVDEVVDDYLDINDAIKNLALKCFADKKSYIDFLKKTYGKVILNDKEKRNLIGILSGMVADLNSNDDGESKL